MKIYINPLHDLGIILSTVSNALTESYKHILLGYGSDIQLDIIVQKNQCDKFKDSDPETNIERLEYVLSLFQKLVPLSFNTHIVDNIPFRSQAVYTSIWPMKHQWVGDKNQIMLKRPAPYGHKDFKSIQTRGLKMDPVYLYAKQYDLEVIEFDYTDPFDWIVDNIIHSKFVVSEYSAMAVLATFLRCPLKIVAEQELKFEIAGNIRPITFGNGNLGLNPRVDFPNKNGIIQQYENTIETLAIGDL